MDNQQPKSTNTLKLILIITLLINLVGCLAVTLISPTLSRSLQGGAFTLMLILAILMMGFGLLAALKPPTRLIGLISLILSLIFAAAWIFALLTPPID